MEYKSIWRERKKQYAGGGGEGKMHRIWAQQHSLLFGEQATYNNNKNNNSNNDHQCYNSQASLLFFVYNYSIFYMYSLKIKEYILLTKIFM